MRSISTASQTSLALGSLFALGFRVTFLPALGNHAPVTSSLLGWFQFLKGECFLRWGLSDTSALRADFLPVFAFSCLEWGLYCTLLEHSSPPEDTSTVGCWALPRCWVRSLIFHFHCSHRTVTQPFIIFSLSSCSLFL